MILLTTTPVLITKLLFLLALVMWVPITAISFFRFRLKKKARDYDRIMATLGLQSEDTLEASALKHEFFPRDYILPVLFTTIVCAVGSVLLLMGGELHFDSVGSPGTIFLSGSYFGASPDTTFPVEARSLMVVSLAFAGAYLWTAQVIARRLLTADLTPGTYYRAGLRIVLSGMVALILAFALDIEGSPLNKAMPAIAFLTGIFPERALIFLRERYKIFAQSGSNDHANALPLSQIEGLSALHIHRLGEVGIDNAQNLAEANLVTLLLKTPFSPSELIDWIAQARLYTCFKGAIIPLRKIGIRTAFDLKNATNSGVTLEEIAQLTGIEVVNLRIVHTRLAADTSLKQLEEYHDILHQIGHQAAVIEPA